MGKTSSSSLNIRLILRRAVLCTALSGILALIVSSRFQKRGDPLTIQVQFQGREYIVPQGAQVRDLEILVGAEIDEKCEEILKARTVIN